MNSVTFITISMCSKKLETIIQKWYTVVCSQEKGTNKKII